MSYVRVIPRDLFNEANLLKCLGALYIALETAGSHKAVLDFDPHKADARFEIDQFNDDGATYVSNLSFTIDGREYFLTRPLNSRDVWPLYARPIDDDEAEDVRVYNEDDGKLSADFLTLIQSSKRHA